MSRLGRALVLASLASGGACACRQPREEPAPAASTPAPAPSVPGKKITRVQLEEMFAKMRATTHWNLNGPMLWTYFFADPDPKKLDPVAKRLIEMGYRLVGLMPPADGGPAMLQVERVEAHTAKTLDARNDELYRLAAELSVVYDGMDVGPPTPK